jgi:hypothetical protein
MIESIEIENEGGERVGKERRMRTRRDRSWRRE